jgi:hypothetical protein
MVLWRDREVDLSRSCRCRYHLIVLFFCWCFLSDVLRLHFKSTRPLKKKAGCMEIDLIMLYE